VVRVQTQAEDVLAVMATAMSIESPGKESMANRPITFIHDLLISMLQKKLCNTSF